MDTIKNLKFEARMSSHMALGFFFIFIIALPAATNENVLDYYLKVLNWLGVEPGFSNSRTIAIAASILSGMFFYSAIGSFSRTMNEIGLHESLTVAPRDLESWQVHRIFTVKSIGSRKVLLLNHNQEEVELNKSEFFDYWQTLEKKAS